MNDVTISNTDIRQLISALSQKLDEVEEKEKTIKAQSEKISAQDKAIEIAQPKIAFHDFFMESNEWMGMDKIAKELAIPNFGRNLMFLFLRDKKVLQNNRKHWNMPYQEYVDRGYFRITKAIIDKGSFYEYPSYQTLVSNKGMMFIKKIIDSELEKWKQSR